MPARDLALLTDAAAEAGRIARRFWRRNPAVWDKPGNGPVTEADLAVNRMLLADLRRARPDYGWLSEETPDDRERLDNERVFIIDPIDGTRAFIAGEEHFAHALAVAERGRVTAAVVHLPVAGLTYAAVADGLATLNGRPLRPSGREDEDGAVALASGAAMMAAHWPGGVPPLRRAFRASLAWRLCLVAEGAFDAMLTFRPTWEWDAAAGCLIAAAAGAAATDADGLAPAFNRRDPRVNGLIVAAPGVHAALMARRRGQSFASPS
ncbi:MAG: 3'(2'),5'-bisphosphate nucleotidase CysQ [Paracoccaceae bacterium]|nr:MAG: 3'(2'),5'-bisphosphate nucleotidase CysQ [Paracoccaceae bacterium]